jgi:hypothetical protein
MFFNESFLNIKFHHNPPKKVSTRGYNQTGQMIYHPNMKLLFEQFVKNVWNGKAKMLVPKIKNLSLCVYKLMIPF